MQESSRSVKRSAVRCVLLLATMIVAFALLPLRGDWWWLGLMIGVGLLVAIEPVVVRRLRRVLASDRPGLDALEAIALVVTMLIIGFSAVYYAIDHDRNQFNGLETRADAVYFTVTTMSTVGFGDITATAQLARMLVTVQILFSVAFAGVIVKIILRAASFRADQRSSSGP